MPDRRGLWLAVALLVSFGLATALLVACDLQAAPPTAMPDGPTATPPPSEPTAAPNNGAPVGRAVITLTVWTTEAFSPTQAITTGQVLAQEVTAFEQTLPDVRLNFVLKKPYGKGGILDFLLTTDAVVPELLPDLVVMDVNELGVVAQAGLLQPLDALVPPELPIDLFPFAREACTLGGQLYGLQFQADLDHSVYDTGKIAIAPRSWPGVLSNPGPFVFPAGGQAGLVNDAFLIQYLAVRPQPIPEGEPFLEIESLTAVLQFYQDGLARGIFPPAVLNYHTTDECWRDYQAGLAAMTQASAHRYLEDQQRLQSSAAAPIPAISGPASALSRGWALALVTPDPVRQSAAVEFIAQWMRPETNAAWNRAAQYLPTRQSALASWSSDEGYRAFIEQQLLLARPRPTLSNYSQVATALQVAVEQVLTGAETPEEAAAQAIASLQ